MTADIKDNDTNNKDLKTNDTSTHDAANNTINNTVNDSINDTMQSCDPALAAPIVDCVHRLADQTTPLCAYIYDLAALKSRIKSIKRCLPANTQLFYAIKANAEPEILEILADTVDGFEAASGGELQWLRAHQPDKPIIFGGPGKLRADLTQAISQQIDTIHVESLVELSRIAQITQELERPASIFLRMNIDIGDIGTSKLVMGGKPTPFGLDESHLEPALAIIAEHPLIQLQGFHFHLMSHQLDATRHGLLMQRYIDKVNQWQTAFSLPSQLMINVGGGMGIHYHQSPQHFDWEAFCEQLAVILAQYPNLILRFEIGRFITAPCGYYVMEVLDIKDNLGEQFVIGHGGTHHFRTPAAQQHNHPFYIVNRGSVQAAPSVGQATDSTSDAPSNAANFEQSVVIDNAVATLVGQLCTPKDVLARQQWIEHLAIGDFMVFPLAGAYAWNISHQNFLMHEPPQKVFLPAC